MSAVLVFPNKYVTGWPVDGKGKPADDARCTLAPVAAVLTYAFPSDAHFAAYAADKHRRHITALLQQDKFAELIPVANLRMVLAVFDVDGAGHKDGATYTNEDWLAELPKLSALLAEHPGAFIYRTRGGYRIVYELNTPYALRSHADEPRWAALYKSWCNYLKRAFGIVADTACADWTRFYRAPRVTRDGVAQELETIGDPSAIGPWGPRLANEDNVSAKRVGPRLAKEDKVHAKRVETPNYRTVQPVPISDPESPYGQARITAAVRYLRTAPLSVKGEGGRTTMFSVCLALVRRMRLPLEIAADLIDEVYNPRLAEAGTSTWSIDEPGPHGGCIVERLEKARDSGTVPIGDVIEEEWWNEMNEIIAKRTARAS